VIDERRLLYRVAMKRQQARQPKLAVRRDTIKQLTRKDLTGVQGGETGAACTGGGIVVPHTTAAPKQ
jgi:hypothetical protein